MIRTIFTLILLTLSMSSINAESVSIDSLTKVLTQVQDTSKVNVLLEIAVEYENTDHHKAFQYALEANNLAHSVNFTIGEIKSCYELAVISFRKSDRAGALPSLELGIEMSQEIKNDLLLALGYFHMSRYYEEESDFTTALDYLNSSLLIYKELNEQLKISQCYTAFGGIYKSMGQYEKALSYYFEALPIKESINDIRGLSNVYSNIGGVYLLTSVYSNAGEAYLLTAKLKEARKYFFKSLAIDRANDDHEAIVYNLTKIGVTYQKLNDYDPALAYYDTALTMAVEHNFKIDESILLGNIGSTLRSLKKYQESLDYLFSALELKKELQRNASAAHTCNDICETYLGIGDYTSAKTYALKAIELARNVDADQHRAALYLLGDCEYKLKDFQSAYDHLVQANMITDSIFTIESEAKMHEMEVKYQSEKKEQEIENLVAINEAAAYRNISYAGAAVSFFILGGLLYYLQQSRIKKNRLLLEKEKEIDRLKSRFFANISHEFRTPLTLILGPINDLLDKTDNKDDKRRISTMKRNAERLLELINQLLDLSKIESGNFKLKTSGADIISVIKGVTMSFLSVAEQHNIELKTEIIPDHLFIDFDRSKFESVLTNLLSNAFKFTADNGAITVKADIINKQKKNTQHNFIRISVEDNGAGIPENEVNLIFDRFYQADNNELLQQEGSGIGLALTKELVELHGGNIYAESKLGVGTKITLELPFVSAEVRTDIPEVDTEPIFAEQAEPEASGFISETKPGLPIVLVIEDNLDVSNYIVEILQETYKVLTAADGQDGIDKAVAELPDLIISDVMMPKKDGFEVCHTLKNDEKTGHIPIILLTAKSDSTDKIKGLTTKADDYITKPFIPAELLIRVQNLIESRRLLRKKYKQNSILSPKEITVNSIDENFLNRLIEIVESQISNEKFGVEELGDEMNMSRSQLHRKLTALLDQGPNQFIRSFRLQRALGLLKQSAATASEVAYRVGFSSPSYFTKCFREQFGYTPSEVNL